MFVDACACYLSPSRSYVISSNDLIFIICACKNLCHCHFYLVDFIYSWTSKRFSVNVMNCCSRKGRITWMKWTLDVIYGYLSCVFFLFSHWFFTLFDMYTQKDLQDCQLNAIQYRREFRWIDQMLPFGIHIVIVYIKDRCTSVSIRMRLFISFINDPLRFVWNGEKAKFNHCMKHQNTWSE